MRSGNAAAVSEKTGNHKGLTHQPPLLEGRTSAAAEGMLQREEETSHGQSQQEDER